MRLAIARYSSNHSTKFSDIKNLEINIPILKNHFSTKIMGLFIYPFFTVIMGIFIRPLPVKEWLTLLVRCF